MKKNLGKFLLSGFVLLPFIFASCTSTKTESAAEIVRNNEKSGKCDYIKIEENSDFLHTDISYPLFDNEPELSRIIKNTVESGWKSFKTIAEKDWNEIASLNSSPAPFEYIVRSAVTYSGNIISVYIETYRYAGGAHGETFIKTFNYDTKTGKDLSITEATNYSYEELSDISRTQLYKKLISENKFEITGEEVNILTEMMDEGTLPMAGNFQNFTLDGNKLYIYFEQYKVAPYSYGIQVVELEI